MTLYKTAARCALFLAMIAAAAPAFAQSDYRDHRGYHNAHWRARHASYRYRDNGRTCGAAKRAHGNNGTAIGAVTGGVLGSAMGGGKVGNVLLGAGAGAVAGHVVGRNTVRC